VSTLTADDTSDNTSPSTLVHRPTAHAAEATWCARLVSPLATSTLPTAASAAACQPCRWWSGPRSRPARAGRPRPAPRPPPSVPAPAVRVGDGAGHGLGTPAPAL